MTIEELAKFDGREGRKAYVAINGNIYDFTGSAMWPNGDHQGAHQAGRDLTEELKNAPHVRALIERFPVIGQLEVATHEKKEKGNGILIGLIIAIIIFIGIVVIM